MTEVKSTTTQSTATKAAPSPHELKAPSPVEVEYEKYAIRKGETLSAIAHARQCPLSDLLTLNKGIDPARLKVGQQIIVPHLVLAASAEGAQKQGSIWYAVKAGDSLAKLAKEDPKLIASIKSLNPGLAERGLQVGQSIRLPDLALFKPLEKAPLQKKESAQQEALAAINVLEDAKVEAEGRGKSWVMSAESRPNPNAYLALHKLLQLSGIHDVPNGGQYTDATRKAIESFQDTHALPIDGKVGPQLLAVLKRDFAGATQQTPALTLPSESHTELLSVVAAGKVKLPYGKPPEALTTEERAMVRELQLLLRETGLAMRPTSAGVYDDATKEAVRHFQRTIMKLPQAEVTGIAGPKTVGMLLKIQKDFLESLDFVLKKEGGVSNDPDDPGGFTYRGVTQRNYDSWRVRNNLDPRPVTEIGIDELRAFYRKGYWNKAHCNELPTGLNCAVLDFAVNAGPGKSVKELSNVCAERGLEIRDISDKSFSDHRDIVSHFTEVRTSFYNDLCNNKPRMAKFLPGLVRRSDDAKQKAFSMIKKAEKE